MSHCISKFLREYHERNGAPSYSKDRVINKNSHSTSTFSPFCVCFTNKITEANFLIQFVANNFYQTKIILKWVTKNFPKNPEPPLMELYKS